MIMPEPDEPLGGPDAEEIVKIVCRHCPGRSEVEIRQIVLAALNRITERGPVPDDATGPS